MIQLHGVTRIAPSVERMIFRVDGLSAFFAFLFRAVLQHEEYRRADSRCDEDAAADDDPQPESEPAVSVFAVRVFGIIRIAVGVRAFFFAVEERHLRGGQHALVAVLDHDLAPFLLRAGVGDSERLASLERVLFDELHAQRDRDLFERSAVGERVRADLRYAAGDRYALQRRAARERSLADRRHAVGKDCFRKSRTVAERAFSYLRHSRGDSHAFEQLAIIERPRPYGSDSLRKADALLAGRTEDERFELPVVQNAVCGTVILVVLAGHDARERRAGEERVFSDLF